MKAELERALVRIEHLKRGITARDDQLRAVGVSLDTKYSIADQAARFQAAKNENNARVLDIDRFFDPSKLKGKKVLVTGANGGLGRALVGALHNAGALVVGTSRKPFEYGVKELDDHSISGVDVTDTASMRAMAKTLAARPDIKDSGFDVVITNAG